MPLPNRALIPLFLFFITIITGLLYTNGLNGPLLYDDTVNLEPLINIESVDSLRQVVDLSLGYKSGPLGRSVSLASFALQKYLNLFDTQYLKAVNILIHLLCGIMLYSLLSKLFNLRTDTKDSAQSFSLLITAIWLLHPLHISSVLYVIQRMTQLATLFSLISLYFYVVYLPKIRFSASLSSFVLPSLLIGLSLTAAVFSKENAILIFPTLLLISSIFTTFSENSKLYKYWLFLFAVLPTAFALYKFGVLVVNSDFSYKGFNFYERAFTQARVIIDYVLQLIIPNINKMTLFHDDFSFSYSLIKPFSTLASIILIAILLSISFVKKTPTLIRFGILWFFIWHLVESTFLPLHIYFEHRNYIPAIGLFVAFISFIIKLFHKLKMPVFAQKGLAASYILYLAISTFLLSEIWSNEESLYNHWLENHPESTNTLIIYSEYYAHKHGPEIGINILNSVQTYPEYKNNITIHLYKWLYQCVAKENSEITEKTLSTITKNPKNYHVSVITAVKSIIVNIDEGFCPPSKTMGLSKAFQNILKNAPQNNNTLWTQSLHSYYATYLLSQNAYSEALTQYSSAYKLRPTQDIMIPMIDLNIILGNNKQARKLLDDLKRIAKQNSKIQDNIIILEKKLGGFEDE